FFFIDVQTDQRDAFARLVADTGGVSPALTPVVRARLASVKRERVGRALLDRRRADGDDAAWYHTREHGVTSMAEAPPTNTIGRGHWWTAAEAGERPRVSLEEAAAKALAVDVGNVLGFDVQVVPVDAVITSIRKVDWQSFSTNFFAIVSP